MNKSGFNNSKKTLLFVFLLLVLILVPAGTVSAVYIDEGDDVIKASEVIDDDVFIDGKNVVVDGTVNGVLFAAGETVTINGTVNGVLFAAGSTIIINGTVNNDIVFFGQMLNVAKEADISGNIFSGGRSIFYDGNVEGSIFSMASDITLSKNAVVGHNFYSAAYSMITDPGSLINIDLNAGGYQIVLGGEIKRDAFTASEALEINGKVGRNVTSDVGIPELEEPFMGPMSYYQYPGLPPVIPAGIRISDTAKIGGSITYTSRETQDSSIKAKPKGGIVHQTPVPSDVKTGHDVQVEVTPKFGFMSSIKWFVGILRSLISLLILGGLAVWLIPTHLNKSVEKVRKHTLPATGWGFVVVTVGYIGSLIVAGVILMAGIFFAIITLGGLCGTVLGIGFSTLSLIMTIFTLLVVYGSKIIVAYLIGSLIIDKLSASDNMKKALALLIGLLIYVIFASIPCFGWVIRIIVTFIGVGAMWLYFQEWRSSRMTMVQPAVSSTETEETGSDDDSSLVTKK